MAAGLSVHGVARLQVADQLIQFGRGIKQVPDAGTGSVEIEILGILGVEKAHLAVQFSGTDLGVTAQGHGSLANMEIFSKIKPGLKAAGLLH